jgi:hypothetical protein
MSMVLSTLMLSVKPSDDLRAGFVDVSAFMPDLLICRPSYQKCGCRPLCRPSSCRFWKPPHAGEVLLKFSTFLYILDFYLVTLVQFLSFFSGTRGRRQTMSEGCRRRMSGHLHLEHRRDPTLGHPNPPSFHEPPAKSYLCIALVNME